MQDTDQLKKTHKCLYTKYTSKLKIKWDCDIDQIHKESEIEEL